MTIIPFPVEGAGRSASSGPAFCAEAAVTGAFGSPSGGTGTFTGAYRLERFVIQYDHLAAAGVFTGELIDADGQPSASAAAATPRLSRSAPTPQPSLPTWGRLT